MLLVQNENILDYMRSNYTLEDIVTLKKFLQQRGTFSFPMRANGLFPASNVASRMRYTGYSNSWVRDNVHVAHAHYVDGMVEVARRNAQALMSLYRDNESIRFEDIIFSRKDPNVVANRPHVRFLENETGANTQATNDDWPHAQNDALGYFLWFYCKLMVGGLIEPSARDLETLALFPLYFDAIHYWNDEDSGHWEETRKIAASSIGTVVAGLRMLRSTFEKTEYASGVTFDSRPITVEFLDVLIDKGVTALKSILPAECVQRDRKKNRRYDAALLFLIYPLDVVSGELADVILNDVIGVLQGSYGIRRYLKDSFWSEDYKLKVAKEMRTTYIGDDISWRDRLAGDNNEAQWCLFDPIVSTIWGLQYSRANSKHLLEKQIYYLNRSLGQLTSDSCEFGGFKCPELYYLDRGRWVVNDVTPLLWCQANLLIALNTIEKNLRIGLG